MPEGTAISSVEEKIAKRARLAYTSGMWVQDTLSLDFKKPQYSDVHKPRDCWKRRLRVTDGDTSLEGLCQLHQVQGATQLLA